MNAVVRVGHDKLEPMGVARGIEQMKQGEGIGPA
jgi:hypothetical protein